MQTVISYEEDGNSYPLAIVVDQLEEEAGVSLDDLPTNVLQMIHHHLVCVQETINKELDRRGV